MDETILSNGDLLFRAGRGWRSEMVRSASGSALTHVGIVEVSKGRRVFVIHAAPPEGKQGGQVRRETFQKFVASDVATTVVAYRPDHDPETLHKVVVEAREFWERSVAFDNDFDLSSAQSVYCSELIWRAFANAGVDVSVIQTQVHMPGMTKSYIMPADIIRMISGRTLATYGATSGLP
ncbi:YiiX/YebB-like N1pC/P60 family cysteine hydrolase [Kamptonema cortianum]|nr:YiiX/YebB-like N1pC/P60 family cysteine hydrolase [Kamptonema cortianum]